MNLTTYRGPSNHCRVGTSEAQPLRLQTRIWRSLAIHSTDLPYYQWQEPPVFTLQIYHYCSLISNPESTPSDPKSQAGIDMEPMVQSSEPPKLTLVDDVYRIINPARMFASSLPQLPNPSTIRNRTISRRDDNWALNFQASHPIEDKKIQMDRHDIPSPHFHIPVDFVNCFFCSL